MSRGGYTFEQIRQMSETEILFLYHYQELLRQQDQEFLTNALGVIWEKENLVGKLESDNQKIEKLFIPLSVAINPEILDYVKKQFNLGGKSKATGPAYVGGGEYMPKPNEEIKPMSDLSKDEFMRLIGRRVK